MLGRVKNGGGRLQEQTRQKKTPERRKETRRRKRTKREDIESLKKKMRKPGL